MSDWIKQYGLFWGIVKYIKHRIGILRCDLNKLIPQKKDPARIKYDRWLKEYIKHIKRLEKERGVEY